MSRPHFLEKFFCFDAEQYVLLTIYKTGQKALEPNILCRFPLIQLSVVFSITIREYFGKETA
jgi:hypothetical protein